ncbi:MAG: hypothetical protein ABIJ65_13055 [Chloroflexota bacterium]
MAWRNRRQLNCWVSPFLGKAARTYGGYFALCCLLMLAALDTLNPT